MKEELKKFLESSLLEEYLLGLCSDDDRRKVEQYIEQYPEVRAEYEQLQDNIEQYARQMATPAPADLKADVLGEIDRLSGATATPPELVQLRRPWWAVAAGIAALLFAGLSFLFWQQKDQLQTEQSALQSELKELKASCEEENRLMAAYQQELQFLRDPGTAKFLLTGNQLAPDVKTVAYWNVEEQRSMINVLNLPALPNKQCYQLWADVDGKMLNLGVLPTDPNALVDLAFLANATSLNLTIEPEGGSDHPTVSRLVANVFI